MPRPDLRDLDQEMPLGIALDTVAAFGYRVQLVRVRNRPETSGTPTVPMGFTPNPQPEQPRSNNADPV